MEAQIVHAHDITVVKLRGFLDYEVADNFKKDCLRNLSGFKVVFDLRDLSFVGSSGITPFVEMLCDFSKVSSNKPRFCGMTSEFKRLFLSSQISEFEMFEDELGAIKSFAVVPQFPLV